MTSPFPFWPMPACSKGRPATNPRSSPKTACSPRLYACHAYLTTQADSRLFLRLHKIGRQQRPIQMNSGAPHYKDSALGFKGVTVKRLAFEIRVEPHQVNRAIRSEWDSYLLELEILNNIDTWWENVRTWLEIATNQRLAQVGHEAIDWFNPHTRTSIWAVDDSGDRQQSTVGGTVIRGPERVLGVTVEILRDCLALATTKPPLAWALLRDVRALQNADQYRRAVIDAATAAEIAATSLIDGLVAGRESEERDKLLKQHQTLGGNATLLGKLGDGPPAGFKEELVQRRNEAVHEGIELKYDEWEAAFRQALALVQKAFPLPTAPGSSEPLTCHWSRTTEALKVRQPPLISPRTGRTAI
jgi:hypothetical protein